MYFHARTDMLNRTVEIDIDANDPNNGDVGIVIAVSDDPPRVKVRFADATMRWFSDGQVYFS